MLVIVLCCFLYWSLSDSPFWFDFCPIPASYANLPALYAELYFYTKYFMVWLIMRFYLSVFVKNKVLVQLLMQSILMILSRSLKTLIHLKFYTIINTEKHMWNTLWEIFPKIMLGNIHLDFKKWFQNYNMWIGI